MKRKDFIRSGCSACVALTALPALFSACKITNIVSGKLTTDGLLIDLSEFKQEKEKQYRSYIIVRNEALLFPICIYRFNEQDYTALWMQCAHQGAELNVVGDYLQCPAHGSEYNNRGKVTNGPADSNLRTFPITVSNKNIFIDLRKA
jgi:Rieske Fe-S protein